MRHKQKVVIIISITSDIGLALAKRYSKEGYTIVGTYRSTSLLNQLKGLPRCHLFSCDIGNKKDIGKFINRYKRLHLPWNVFISCPCTPLPLRAFFKSDFDEWSDSIHINAIEQLRIVHQIYPYRDKNKIVDIVFFSGGGVNNAVINFSAYTVSKIMLIKMCEFLDAEDKNINIFIVGPGWTRTKSHYLVLRHVGRNDERYRKVTDFLKNGKGTDMEDIYKCIKWLCGQGKRLVSGRNFSIVNDKWKGPYNKKLINELRRDPDMYKLRRHKNYFLT
jgi:NAD(P)-dependent dehydrogenase (short-subunit alcohol dehydrogenase family)